MVRKKTKYEKCKDAVRRKIKNKEIKATFRCTKDGTPSKKGKHRCKTSEFAICHRLKKTKRRRKR